MNLLLEQLRNSIFQAINEANLPPGCVYFILKDIFRDVEMAYLRIIEEEAKNPHMYDEYQEEKTIPVEELFDIVQETINTKDATESKEEKQNEGK